jgi:hypothetical protein
MDKEASTKEEFLEWLDAWPTGSSILNFTEWSELEGEDNDEKGELLLEEFPTLLNLPSYLWRDIVTYHLEVPQVH